MDSRLRGAAPCLKAALHHHRAHPGDRMEGLGKFAQVEGLGGQVEQPLAPPDLVPLPRGIELARIG